MEAKTEIKCNLAGIPEELKEIPRWFVTTRTIINKNSPENPKPKAPLYFDKKEKSLKNASWKRQQTFEKMLSTDWKKAEIICLEKDIFSDLCFVNIGYSYIDLDKVLTNGEITGNDILTKEETELIINLCSCTYGEYSCSGSGLHFIFKGEITKENLAESFEISVIKPLTMTGNIYKNCSKITEITEETKEKLLAIYNQILKRIKPIETPAKAGIKPKDKPILKSLNDYLKAVESCNYHRNNAYNSLCFQFLKTWIKNLDLKNGDDDDKIKELFIESGVKAGLTKEECKSTFESAFNSVEKAKIEEDNQLERYINFNLECLGIDDAQNKIVIYCKQRNRIFELDFDFSEPVLISKIGSDIPEAFKFRQIKNRIIINCSKNELKIDKRINTGIHLINEDILLIDNRIFNYSKNEEIQKPFFNNRIIERNEKPIFELLKDQNNNIFFEINKIVKELWSFADKENQDQLADYLTAFIMLAPLQKLMSWRPILYIIGKKGSGKTCLTEFLSFLYPNLIKTSSNLTFASMYQSFGNCGKIAIFDEFQTYQEKEKILNALKGSSKNSENTVSKGSKEMIAKDYELNILPFILSNEYFAFDSAIKSRVNKFELEGTFKHSFFSELVLKQEKKIKELGNQSINWLLENWRLIEEHSKDNFFEESRIKSNYGYAFALIDLAKQGKAEKPEFLINDDDDDDDDNLIKDILGAFIFFEKDNWTVSELLNKYHDLNSYNIFNILLNYGIGIKSEHEIILQARAIKNHLLKNISDYKTYKEETFTAIFKRLSSLGIQTYRLIVESKSFKGYKINIKKYLNL